MIPRTIHYCWFGGNPLREEEQNCIRSWKRYCSDFEIKKWDEGTFDVTSNEYCKEAFEAGKWAFVSDYARLKIIEEYGGIYLDTDVEVLKSLSPLISDSIGFLGFQNAEQVNTGLGFAAAPHNTCVKAMLKLYETRHFLFSDGSCDLTPCPVVNTVALKFFGLKTGYASKKIQYLDGLRVYPLDYFNPMNADTRRIKLTKNSYTIHHYQASWLTAEQKEKQKFKRLVPCYFLKIRTDYVSRRAVQKFERKHEIKR